MKKQLLIMKHLKKFNEMSSYETAIYSALNRAIKETPSVDYDDVYDWMQVVFSQVEDELEDILPEEVFDDLRMDYDQYVMSQFGE